MKLNRNAFSWSIAGVTGFFYVIFYILMQTGPTAFQFLFNAQFLGADITSLIPAGFTFTDFIWTFVTVVITAWIMGWLWATLYNRFLK